MSLTAGGSRSEKVMRESFIIVGEFPTSEGSISRRTMIGAITPVEVKGSDLLPARKEVNLISPTMIAGVAFYFKRMRVSALVKTRVPTPPIKASVVVFLMPQLPVLLVEEVVVRTFIRAGTEEFKNVFADLALSCTLFNFSILTDKEM